MVWTFWVEVGSALSCMRHGDFPLCLVIAPYRPATHCPCLEPFPSSSSACPHAGLSRAGAFVSSQETLGSGCKVQRLQAAQ